MADFEDAVQYVICERNGCDALVTRNKADFGDRANVLDPAELIERLRNSGS
jgi:predicted nucleic acid-binding protein